ncbi:hypothetical protein PHMEG_00026296 [Phytophthora megakarya]|uniref:CCHC-type domain-containing protein n=1 Tax=Phytophthora megakarya TaxID=4795 RepID=A0A225VAQ9_9STRA|nr:hypothetical protein PHMEG_00026296 [Phytophthora megakarya]
MREVTEQTAPRQVVVREKAKALKLAKFRGLDDAMPVTMGLKTVRAEVRRQAVTMGVQWSEAQLYHEVASHLDGEAKRWFATVMESVQPEDESIGTLAAMLCTKYMGQRTGPEVVDLLNERLVEYAQALREIAERGDVGEDWLVNAFLKGMNSPEGATHVRGHRPMKLDEAVNLAVPHIGDNGEGYGVRLETAMARWDQREAQQGRGPLAATAATDGDKEQSGLSGNLGSVVSGYGPAWGTPQTPPRYDTQGRPVTTGEASLNEWWKANPPGYQLVPAGDSSKTRTASSGQYGTQGKRPSSGGDQHVRRPAKTYKVEATNGGSAQATRSVYNPVFTTREGRLKNLERYQARQATRAPFVPRPGTECFYCGELGHFARGCPLKKADLAAGHVAGAHGLAEGSEQETENGSRA